MKPEVDLSVKQQGWPANQFHPVYDSFNDWLDGEAPITAEAKQHNQPRFSLLDKPGRTSVVE